MIFMFISRQFFSQLLNVYSLIIAAIISIANRGLTKPHTVVSLGLAASPLSIYLIIYVIQSIFGKRNRLASVFGSGKWLNRAGVLALVPIWISVLVFAALPKGSWHFQQSACDDVVAAHHVIRVFFIPFLVFFEVFPELGAAIIAIFVGSWILAIYLQRRKIWRNDNKRFPSLRIWWVSFSLMIGFRWSDQRTLYRRKVVNAYPFIKFCTVVFVPHAFWMLNVEIGIAVLLTQETFTPTYGQVRKLSHLFGVPFTKILTAFGSIRHHSALDSALPSPPSSAPVVPRSHLGALPHMPA
jgi:hypothetical protein